ncbi:putative 28S rRNA (cytosine-C(5))-methyltransferase [Nymphon striatum]|nr:putative 28S rRNA (cytosine-C(5))-methyltransferase [Nymphon striatum]
MILGNKQTFFYAVCQIDASEKLIESPKNYQKPLDVISELATYGKKDFPAIGRRFSSETADTLREQGATWHRSCYASTTNKAVLDRAKALKNRYLGKHDGDMLTYHYQHRRKFVCCLESCGSDGSSEAIIFRSVPVINCNKQEKFSSKNRNALYALVHQTLKYRHVINRVAEKINLFEHEPRLDQVIAQLLIYELLYSKKKGLKGESKAVVAILNHENSIREAFDSLDESKDCVNVTKALPRYVRVNTLKSTVEDVINSLADEGFQQVQYPQDISHENYTDLLRRMDRWQFLQDKHIPEILVFHSKQPFFSHPLYQDGFILLQDKASCLPAMILNPPPGSTVFDACAAPGMKTTHLAAIMNNSGQIYATDHNHKRLSTLKNIVESAGVECCHAFPEDFSRINPAGYADVQYILLDPSCSGSGIVNRVDTQEDLNHPVERLRKLSFFQKILLKHALSFPSVKKVIYSTCSIEEQENEEVVTEVLSEWKKEFKVVKIFKDWPTRGSSDFKIGHKCIRANSDSDLTNGFFVAMFKRRKKNVEVESSQVVNDNDGTENVDEMEP